MGNFGKDLFPVSSRQLAEDASERREPVRLAIINPKEHSTSPRAIDFAVLVGSFTKECLSQSAA